jgi:hypothetical protein
LINVTTQLLTTYSEWGWLVFACVPGYWALKVFKYFWAWVEGSGKRGGDEEEEMDPKLKRKMERKANKVKYIRSR